MFYFVNTYYASGMEKLELVPQVLRLTTEVDLALGLFAGGIAALIIELLSQRRRLAFAVSAILAVISVVAVLPRQLALSRELPAFTRPAEEVKVDLTKLPEKEVADKLGQLVQGDERVIVPGNYGFYLNYFSDIPQLRGALFQSSIHPWPEHIYYQVTNGEDGDISLAWLKIANVGWLVYGGPRELFRDYKVPPEKFSEAGLELVDDIQGDRFFQVPLKDASLAKIVPETLKKTLVPKNAIDREPIFKYVDLLERSPRKASIKEGENGNYEVTAETAADELILVQIAYAPGWKVKDQKGRELSVSRDPMGFILIDPKESGNNILNLGYTMPWQVWFGYLVTFGTCVCLLYLLVRFRRPIFEFKTAMKELVQEDDS